MGALLFCTDNVTLPSSEDRSYRDLRDDRVSAGFEHGAAIVLDVLAEVGETDEAQ